MCKLTIITPTYNRADLLPRCFESLNCQTNYDFEWIIVDDGSTDNTAEVVSAFRTERFAIQYVQKPNGGKHTALNTAHPYIHGQYVLILDSDDYLTDTAVQEVLDAWSRYDANEQVGIVTLLKGTDREHPVCSAPDFDIPVEIMRYQRIRYTKTDCCEVIRTELFLKYPFPEFSGEKFLAESALWDQVSFTHKTVYINSVIYICEYLEGGLTKSGRLMRIHNPNGGMFTSNLRMDKSNYFSNRLKCGLLYTCYGCFAGLSPVQMARNCRAKSMMWVCLPFGAALHCYWKARYSKR